MFIKKVVIQNYRCLDKCIFELNPTLNIIVGDNECGKSTLLEAINLVLTGQLNGRPLNVEMHPHLVNAGAVSKWIADLNAGKNGDPPGFSIELYFAAHEDLVKLKGKNNSDKDPEAYGVTLAVQLKSAFKAEYQEYIKNPKVVRTVPIEYYETELMGFDGNPKIARDIPIHPKFIDASIVTSNITTNRYLAGMVKETLDKPEQVQLSLSYRMMKDKFLEDESVQRINKDLATKKGVLTDKTLSMSLDTTARGNWESGIMPMLDDIPLPLVGKGEQNSVNIQVAMDKAADSHIFLIEEPESRQSPANLAKLIYRINAKKGGRQVLITTHSSFVLNTLGIENVYLFYQGNSTTLAALPPDTRDYFMKLPGYNTLRLVLAKRAILVEGPSDELIVKKAYLMTHGKLPLEAGVEVITVDSLAFKRFLDIAVVLGNPVAVVTDNDGDAARVAAKYDGYADKDNIKLCYDGDVAYPSLEPQLLKTNGRAAVNAILGTNYAADDQLLTHMKNNKANSALKFFNTDVVWNVPEYIQRAIG